MTEVYLLTFLNGKRYVGITDIGVLVRLKVHKTARSGLVRHAIRKHGLPTVKVICQGERQAMRRIERILIRRLETLMPKGYNLLPGGEGFSSADMRERWRDPEFRAKTTAAMRGVPHGDAKALEDWRKKLERDPVAKAAYSAKLTARNKRRWAVPGAREEHGRKVRATMERKRARQQ